MKRLIIVLIVFGVAWIVTGCEEQVFSPGKSQVSLETEASPVSAASSVNQTRQSKAVLEPCLIRPTFPDWPSEYFQIERAAINGDILSLTLSYSGGCKVHEFKLVAFPFQESHPVQVQTEIFHNGNNDACDQWITEVRQFDLTPLKLFYRDNYGTSCGEIGINFQDAETRELSVIYSFCDEG